MNTVKSKRHSTRGTAAARAPRGEPFDINCRRCTRLAGFLDQVREQHPGYYAHPVPAFGETQPRLLIVGLAPGLHGANRTGRPFTGDHAGLLLYRTLHHFGFATAPESRSADDSLRLIGCKIANALACVPPQNKPNPDEIINCNSKLWFHLNVMQENSVILALGAIAHKAVLMAFGVAQARHRFAHGAEHRLPNGAWLIDSYHCSRYNTQTGRLTDAMFEAIFERIAVRTESAVAARS